MAVGRHEATTPHYGHAGDPRHLQEMQDQTRERITMPDFPPGCLFVQREDNRALDYGLGIPHAPYVDNHFAGVALRPHYRDEHDEPTWQECVDRRGYSIDGFDIKTVAELPFMGDDDSPELCRNVAEAHIDNDEEADPVYRANYEAIEADIKKCNFDALYDGGEIWLEVGTYSEGKGQLCPDRLRWLGDTEQALEHYPCLNDERASELQHEEEMKKRDEWFEDKEEVIQTLTSLTAATVKVLDDTLERDASAFYKDGEFMEDPEPIEVALSIIDHVPAPPGLAVLRHPSRGHLLRRGRAPRPRQPLLRLLLRRLPHRGPEVQPAVTLRARHALQASSSSVNAPSWPSWNGPT